MFTFAKPAFPALVALATLFAAAEASAAPATTILTWNEGSEAHRVLLREGRTTGGAAEVRVTARFNPAPRVFSESAFARFQPLLLVGRDTDADERPDLWFSIGSDGITASRNEPAANKNGSDIVFRYLRDGLAPEARQTLRQVFKSAIGPLLMSVALAENDYERFLDMQMNLIEAEMKVDRLAAAHALSDAESVDAYERIAEEWEASYARFKSMSRGHLFWAHGVFDIGVYATVSYGFKLIGALAKNGLPASVTTYLTKVVGEGALRIAERFGAIAEGSIERLHLKQAAKPALKVLPAAKNLATGIAAGVKQDLLYISLSQTTQVLVETSARWDLVDEPNPLKKILKIFSDKDFLQNFLYMSNETILTNGLLNHLQARSFVTKMFAMGTISFIDSSIMSYLIKDNVDPARTTFDTGWEIVAGNGQTLIDNATRQAFRRLAEQKANPKLMGFAYAANLLDQAFGYYLYNQVTTYLDRNPAAFKRFMHDINVLEAKRKRAERKAALAPSNLAP